MVNSPTAQAKPIVGVVMLNTQFPRYLGDVGNADSFRCRVLYRTVMDARVAGVVQTNAVDSALLEKICDAADELVNQGASMITTSCGFLHAVQLLLAERLSVPVVSSSLTILPLLQSIYGHKAPIGILTFDSNALSKEHLGPHVTGDSLVIEGLQNSSYFHSVIANDLAQADQAAMRSDAVTAATRLATARPSAVLLECTNLSPYRAEIAEVLGVPVFDLLDVVHWQLGI